jgi:hypothetical protein
MKSIGKRINRPTPMKQTKSGIILQPKAEDKPSKVK